MSEILYAAYGSNSDLDDLQKWCDRHRPMNTREQLVPVSNALVLDHEPAFDYRSTSRGGRALNLRHRKGAVTEVMLFSATSAAWAALDKKEGVEQGRYEHKKVVALLPDGSEMTAITYVACKRHIERTHEAPTKAYLDIVTNGRKAWGLNGAALLAAAKGETAHSDVDGLFVYGTLMRGQSRFDCVRPFGLECTLLAKVPGRLVDRGAWPGMIPAEASGDWVQGEFFRFRQIGDALDALDEIEGFHGILEGSLFRRTLVTVDVGDGRLRRAWSYMLASGLDMATPIPSGDWRMHRGCRDTFLARLADAHAQCVGGPESIANHLAREVPFVMGGPMETVATQLQPLARALSEGVLSERRLAQQSGRWAMIP